MDFTPDDTGYRGFPDQVVNPYRDGETAAWRTSDWDPALRFWTLPFDPNLGEWLRATDPTLASIMAAREFGARHDRWLIPAPALLARGWLELRDIEWRLRPAAPDPKAERRRANRFVRGEIEQLRMLMQDDRERYLEECEMQADGVPDYVISFIGADRSRHPWTVELISCALAISNIAYMAYKNRFRRVRPSFLCPGLVPPFGPPGHPAFPSGHSFAGHLIALFLLEIRSLAERYGVFGDVARQRGVRPGKTTLATTKEVNSPLIWLAQRLGKNRERIGVHYFTDTTASRHLASGIWWALLHEPDPGQRIHCPTLLDVLRKARAEWPSRWL